MNTAAALIVFASISLGSVGERLFGWWTAPPIVVARASSRPNDCICECRAASLALACLLGGIVLGGALVWLAGRQNRPPRDRCFVPITGR
jgi:hypothetical protein